MPFDPFKVGLNLQLASLFHFEKNVLNNVFILYRLAGRCFPSILAPINIPCGDTINGIPTVGDNYNVSTSGNNFECSVDRSEFSALVGLPGSG